MKKILSIFVCLTFIFIFSDLIGQYTDVECFYREKRCTKHCRQDYKGSRQMECIDNCERELRNCQKRLQSEYEDKLKIEK